MDDRVIFANELVFKNVQGWVGDRLFQVVDFINEVHETQDVSGDIAEIGVHHGMLFFLLSSIGRDSEQCIAVDLFDDQEKNLDKSGGGGGIRTFTGHLDTLFPHIADRVRIVQRDSMSITPSTARTVLGTGGVRVFSVDGGHTVSHVTNDLAIAQEIIVPGGFVLLDDFLGPAWPSVTEGFFSYMARLNVRLAPFLIFQNKLILTTFSEHQQTLAALRKYVDKMPDLHTQWRYTQMCGFDVLAYFGK